MERFSFQKASGNSQRAFGCAASLLSEQYSLAGDLVSSKMFSESIRKDLSEIREREKERERESEG